MALTKISTSGVKDDAVTNAKVADDAIGVAQLSASGTASSSTFLRGDNSWTAVSGTTINNNADNRVITGSGTANTLNGEANLTYDGSNFQFTTAANGQQVLLKSTGNYYNKLSFDSNVSSAGDSLAFVDFSWDGDKVADIMALAGNDTTNKDDGQLSFRTSPAQGSIAERMRITQAGKVGINESSPQQQLHVHDDTIYNGILINGNAAPRVGFARSTTTTGEWSVGIDGTNGNNFAINSSNDNQNNKIIIDSSSVQLVAGNVTVPNGNVVMGATRGIDFSADANATGSANELLDDYEEGTWTPVIKYSGGRLTPHADHLGVYTKIGNNVTVTGTLRWTGIADASDTSWFVRVDGLPFTPKGYGSGMYRTGQVLGATNSSSINPSNSNYTNLVIFLDMNASYFYIVQHNVASGGYDHTPTVHGSGQIYGFQLTYQSN